MCECAPARNEKQAGSLCVRGCQVSRPFYPLATPYCRPALSTIGIQKRVFTGEHARHNEHGICQLTGTAAWFLAALNHGHLLGGKRLD
jgi:hypothetical protein